MSKESENRRLMKDAGANDLLNKAGPVEQLFDAIRVSTDHGSSTPITG